MANVGEKSEKVIVAGRKPVEELLLERASSVDIAHFRKGRLDPKLSRLVGLCKEYGVRYKFVDAASLERLFRGNHQGVVAQVSALEYAELDQLLTAAKDAPLPLIVALDRVQDTGNVGAIARTLWALGGAGLVVPQHEGAYLGANAVKASAGALTHLPVARVVNMARMLEQAVESGFTTYCAGDMEGAWNVFDEKVSLSLPAVLVLGNEEKGVRPGVAKQCDAGLVIPLKRDFDSLNVASAGAILMARFSQIKG
jgi:23S rRNA (guanosine2251-2'-O)-methyltransferase